MFPMVITAVKSSCCGMSVHNDETSKESSKSVLNTSCWSSSWIKWLVSFR